MSTKIIQQLHQSPGHWVLSVTGGGSSAISSILAVPGASRTLVEATVPYNQPSLENYLGGTVDQACSSQTAQAMAMASFIRCRKLMPEAPADTVFGLGCTAAIATDRTRRGANRCHIAVQTHNSTTSLSLTFQEDRSREEEEQICRDLILMLMSEASGIKVTVDQITEKDELDKQTHRADSRQAQLHSEVLSSTWSEDEAPHVIFPGAFNPLHEGHQQIIDLATQHYKDDVVLEISVTNVEKYPLNFIEIDRRCKALATHKYVLTNAPTFLQKSSLFPGCNFVVGTDTLLRIADPVFYNDSIAARDAAIQLLSERGHEFLVFGREIGKEFTALGDLEIPKDLRAISVGIPESAFRIDQSSRQIRQKHDKN
jgi:cytidyltransferase-like protein